MAVSFRENLKELAADIEQRCRVVREAHFAAATFWDRAGLGLGLFAVLVGVVGGGAAGTGIFGNANPALAGVFGTMAGLTAAATAFLKPSDRVEGHKRAGDSWSILRDRAASLWRLRIFSEPDDGKLQAEYDDLLKSKEKVTRESPIVPTGSFNRARKQLTEKKGQAKEALVTSGGPARDRAPPSLGAPPTR